MLTGDLGWENGPQALAAEVSSMPLRDFAPQEQSRTVWETSRAAKRFPSGNFSIMHTIPSRKGAWVQRRVSKSQGGLRSQTTVPAGSRMHQCDRSCMKVDAGVGSAMLMVVQRPRGGLATASGCSHFFFE